MATKPRFIFFTDFDGTVTQQDSNDLLTDTLGFGVELRRQGNRDVLEGRRAFRDSFEEMMDSVSATTGFADCIATLRRNIALDPHFAEFFAWARDYNVPIVVLSGGMRPIIQALLGSLLGESEAETMQIVSNNVAPRVDGGDINVPGGWQIVFRDDR